MINLVSTIGEVLPLDIVAAPICCRRCGTGDV